MFKCNETFLFGPNNEIFSSFTVFEIVHEFWEH